MGDAVRVLGQRLERIALARCPGQARVVITRSTASVPGCPDWSVKTEANYNNATSPGFGCGVNSNLAAMIANPADTFIPAQTAAGGYTRTATPGAVQ